MIAADGTPRKLWSSHDDVVYALDFDNSGRLIAGTGNKGRIYAIDKNGEYSDLLRASASQVTSFSQGSGRRAVLLQQQSGQDHADQQLARS